MDTGWESLEIVSNCSKLSIILGMINNGWEWCAYVGNVREWYQVGNCPCLKDILRFIWFGSLVLELWLWNFSLVAFA